MTTRYLGILLYLLFIYSIGYAQNYADEIRDIISKAGGVYFTYPAQSNLSTSPPPGFSPFYISHIGRHGSRYLLKEDDYLIPLEMLETAKKENVLTPVGDSLYSCLRILHNDTKNRAGDLTLKGVDQHRGIAERMYFSFPEIFSDNNTVNARSTMVMRCAMSMAAFTERLKELNPNLKIIRDPSERNTAYMNYQSKEAEKYNSASGPWKEEYRKLRETLAPTTTVLPKVFSDSTFIRRFVNPVDFTCRLYTIIVGLQNLDKDYGFPEVFNVDELIALWKIYNYRMYVHYSNYKPSNRAVILSSRPLLKEFIKNAEAALQSQSPSADLRFGHDINIIPLAGLMGIKGTAECTDNPYDIPLVFQDYDVSPMASNIQLVFFKDKTNNVIVKFLHNEKETSIPIESSIYPFYKWEDVKDYFNSLLTDEAR